MKLRYHRTFQKQVVKLKPAEVKRLKEALELFMVDPNDPNLYDHSLFGEWKGHRSISFGGDWRAHYIVIGQDIVLFVAAGTHSQLYK